MLSNFNLYADSKDTLAGKKVLKVKVSNEHLKMLNKASTLLISCVDFDLATKKRTN